MKKCIPFLVLLGIVSHFNIGSASEVCAKLFAIGKKEKTQNELENEFLHAMRLYFKRRSGEVGILFTPLPVKAAGRISQHWEELDGKLRAGERITIPMYYADIQKEIENIGGVDISFCVEKFVEKRRQGLETNQWINELFGKMAQAYPIYAYEINRARFGDISKIPKLDDSWLKPSNSKSSKKKERESKKEEERKRRQAEEQEKQKGKWLSEIHNILKSQREPAKAAILDYLNLLKIKVANKGEDSKLALTFGYGTTQENTKSLDLARKIIEDFDGDGKILVDGDSPMGQEIAQIDLKKTLLIAGTEMETSGIETIVVRNDYLRMKLFKNAKKTVTSIDSPIGLGIIFNEGDAIIYDPEHRWTANLQNWSREIPVKLGLPSFYNAGREVSAEGVLKALNAKSSKSWDFGGKFSWKESEREVPTSAKLEDLSASKIADILNTAIAAEKDYQDLTRDSSGKPYPGGAVVFGSSQNHHQYTKMIWDITNYLASRGVTIATGGSGGFMEVANDAAFSAGAHSIGIPIGGRHDLKNEKTINSDLHTVTIPASGYEDRIPNLLHRRKMIIFAPGGSGTMKELATAFFKVAKAMTSDEIIVFMSKDYYGTMFEGLQNSALPQSLRSKIFLVDSIEDMQKLYESYESQIADKSSLRTSQSPVPRNSNKTFRGIEYRSNEPFYEKDYKPGKGFFSDEENYDWD